MPFLSLCWSATAAASCYPQPYVWRSYCSGSLEPESSYHDRDWIMELAMEADILTVTGILTPEGASVESCFPFDITISQSWFPLPCLHETPLYHRGRETSSWFWANTLVTLKIQMYTDGYRICILRVTIGGYRITARYWQHGLTSLDRPRGLAGVHRSGHDLFPRINKKRLFWLELDKMIRRCN